MSLSLFPRTARQSVGASSSALASRAAVPAVLRGPIPSSSRCIAPGAAPSSSRVPVASTPVSLHRRCFSSRGTAPVFGKSRPGEGKDSRKAARRADRLAKMGVDTSKVKEENYSLEEAVRILKAVEVARPRSAIEVHIVTTVSSHQANALRGRITFPHSASTKVPTLLVFAADGTPAADAAKKFQAANPTAKVIVGGDPLIAEVVDNRVGDFDKVLASPEMLPNLSRRLARSLGPQGLMPNVKRGTVAQSNEEMTEAIEQAIGALDWRGDKQAVIRTAIGRAAFSLDQVRDNLRALVASIVDRASSNALGGGPSGTSSRSSGFKLPARPDGVPPPPDVVKRVRSVLKQIHLSSTRGPGIRLDLPEAL